MPYYLIADKSTIKNPALAGQVTTHSDRPELLGMVRDLNAEDQEPFFKQSIEQTKKGSLDRRVAEGALRRLRNDSALEGFVRDLEEGYSFLVSTEIVTRGNKKVEVPRGYVSLRLPQGKRGPIETFRSVVAVSARRKGIATKMTYRLIGIARKAGIRTIERNELDWTMSKLMKKMKDNPRKTTGRMIKTKPETITVKKSTETGIGKAKITVKPKRQLYRKPK